MRDSVRLQSLSTQEDICKHLLMIFRPMGFTPNHFGRKEWKVFVCLFLSFFLFPSPPP